MSPEQAKGERVDERTDVFSLGIVIYEMITGRTPFAGDSVSETFANLINAEPQPLLRYASNMPDELQRIVSKMLRKNKDERYQTMKDILTDLKDVQQELEFQNKLERTIPPLREEAKTQIIDAATTYAPQTPSSAKYVASEIKKSALIIGLLVLILAAIGSGYWFFAGRSARTTPIESIAILPFVNDSGTSDVEYLSDGMTETLIGSLSQIPNLNVKARSSVFRYKGKDTNAQTIGKELNVQAILTGRVVQRGQDLILYVELVDAATENSLWIQIYNKTMTNLVVLQNDIARDVADKLKVKLSGADEQKLAKNYTEDVEAYQFYLKGRYHLLKTTRSEFQTSLSYFQQAIAIDPSYALAYAGLADAYRSLSVAGEMSSTEVMPKAKAAGQKAIEIDDTLAEAHAVLGWIIFWYDWDWNAAENQYRRALELDPNNADTHLFYAHLLSNTGRHTEALSEGKRARELDPLNLRINALEGLYLIHAGRIDEAVASLQKTSELDANYWLPHLFASSAYIEKGMYSEAVAEARKARESSGATSQPIAFLGYALAKSGKQAEARVELERLLKLSTEGYVSLYTIAMIYNGLGEQDETLAWLERGFQQRDPRMVFLKVEPKWSNLSADPRFKDLLRRVGFPQ